MTAGNTGETGGTSSRRIWSAYDLRHRFDWLNQFTDDELRDITFCDERKPLQDSGEYFDVSYPERGVIIAHSGEMVPRGSCYLWRGSVTEATWNKLLSFGQSFRQAGQ